MRLMSDQSPPGRARPNDRSDSDPRTRMVHGQGEGVVGHSSGDGWMLRQVGAIMGWDRRPLAGGPAGTRSKSIIGSSSDCEWAGVFGPTVKRRYHTNAERYVQVAGAESRRRETNERAASMAMRAHAMTRRLDEPSLHWATDLVGRFCRDFLRN
jgi:hypothetical protein